MTSREAVRAVALSLVIITALWHYRRQHMAFREEFEALRPYEAMVMSLRQNPDFLMREYLSQPLQQIPRRSHETADAQQPRLVVFTDFQCPACYCNARAVEGRIAKSFDGRLTVSIRHYPLCRACNPDVHSNAGHDQSCDAAYAVEAARRIGGDAAARKMYQALFENRTNLNRSMYRRLAVEIGLDVERFLFEMDGDEVREIVRQDIALAKRLGVEGTPTMFLDGRRIPELCKGSVFWETLASQTGQSPAGSGSPWTAGATGSLLPVPARADKPPVAPRVNRQSPAMEGDTVNTALASQAPESTEY